MTELESPATLGPSLFYTWIGASGSGLTQVSTTRVHCLHLATERTLPEQPLPIAVTPLPTQCKVGK